MRLDTRRVRSDMIETFKIIKLMVTVIATQIYSLNSIRVAENNILTNYSKNRVKLT